MKFSTSIMAGLAAVCVTLCGSVTQAQPTITSVSPNGTYLYVETNALSFTASSAVNITNVSVQLNGTEFTTGRSILRVLTSSGGLAITGPATSEAVSVPLTSNMTYTAAIQVWDADGATTISNVSFSTVIPGYTFEAEDFDYTSNGVSGAYFDNPQTNAYANLPSTSGSDYVNSVQQGNQDYRPWGLETETLNSDTPRLSRGGLQDYDVGWNNSANPSNWGNYTRHYPAGTYYVYVRASNGNGQASDDASLSVVSGTASFAGTGPYTFSVPSTGWPNYVWVPVLDANNNLAVITSDGSASTIRVTTDNGSYNANFYMLMPTNANATIPGTAVISNFSPDGTHQFQDASQFVFNVTSPVGVNSGDVVVQLTGTPLGGQSSTAVLTDGSGLNVAGLPTNLNVSLPLNTNTAYTAYIQVIETNGNISSTNISFDTVYPGYYTFEAEDWNYGAGQFIDNPQTNLYSGLNGVSGVDYVNPGTDTEGNYGRAGLNLEDVGDVPRLPYLDTNINEYTGYTNEDFDVGNTSGGQWANYTRTFPSGVFNIYMRASDGIGANSDSAKMSEVTSDQTQPNQSTLQLGTFSVPSTGSWTKYAWVPLINSGGGLARFSGGAVETLRMTIDNGNCNANYFMIVPADLSHNDPPFVSSVWPDGSTMFQSTNELSFVVNSDAGITTNNIVVNLNGRSATGLTFNGSPNLWSVACPIQSNTAYTVIITLTDSTATTVSTNYFDTFDTNTAYVFDTEDYDYGGGQFIDNPSPGAYAGYGGVLNVDDYWDYNVGTGYRPSAGTGEGLSTESPSGDIVRPGYSSANYDIGHNDTGNWANYTRHYPAGTYNIWMRYASPNGSPNITDAAKVSLVTGGWGATGQTTTQLGTFTTHNTGGWGIYIGGWVPLIDANGDMAQFVSDGSTNTLKYTVDSGGYNVDFFALVPADTNAPVISNAYPNGAYRFENSSTLSFTASSAGGLDGSGISVLLTGTNLLGQAFTTNITTANGLNIINSTSTSLNASLNLAVNTVYTAVITVTALNGEQVTTTLHFDTINPSMTFEAEDWNYSTNGISGLFIDNPQTNAYANLNSTAGIDYSNSVIGQGNSDYRPQGLETENGGTDSTPPRQQYAGGLLDYDVGFNNGGSGNWANYTRTFPAGVYNIYMRGANGASAVGAVQTDAASMLLVTSAATNANQTTLKLGTFDVPNFGGWPVYGNVPLIDSDGNYAEFVGGAQETLRVATDNGSYNPNYYFLVPADATLPVNPPHLQAALNGANVVVSFLTRTNTSYVLQFKANLTDPTWTPVSTNSGTASWMSITNGINGGSGFYSLKP